MSVKASIVVVSWNSWGVLERCLRSLSEGGVPAPELEVFVVDNASADGTAEKVRAAFPTVYLIENPDNRGFAAANNQALVEARGRYLVLLNPDTEVRGGAIRRMLEVLEGDPNVGACGPRLVSPDGCVQVASARRLPNPFTCAYRATGLDRFGHQIYLPFSGYRNMEVDHRVEAISGACLIVRRDVFERVGLLDEELPMGGEDIDYCRRVLDAGWAILYHADAEVMHIGGASRALAVGRTDIEGFRAIHAYLIKHGQTALAAGYRAMLAGAMVPRMLVWAALKATNRESRAVLEQKLDASRALLRWAVGW